MPFRWLLVSTTDSPRSMAKDRVTQTSSKNRLKPALAAKMRYKYFIVYNSSKTNISELTLFYDFSL